MDLNRCEFLGTIIKEPKVHSFANGRSVLNIDIAVNKKYYSKTAGKYVDGKTVFLRVSAWISVEYFERTLRKGMKVLVIGELAIDSKDGKYYTTIQINNWHTHTLYPISKVRDLGGSKDEYALTEEEEEQIVVDDTSADVGVPF